MFCNEPIIRAYEGFDEYKSIEGANSWFDVYYDLAYHLTEGYRIVLETEHYYISLDIHGVTLCEKTVPIEMFQHPGEWLEPYIHVDDGFTPWTSYESTLFVGERLHSVETMSDHFLLHFDDFMLKIIPHSLGDSDFPSLRNKDHWSYNYVLGAQRHLARKCACGGNGELLLDFVSDYVVRCNKCKMSTHAHMIAVEAIKEWNDGRNECDLSNIVIE